MIDNNDNFLFNKLPVINEGNNNKWLIYSPFTQQKIRVHKKENINKKLYSQINEKYPNFFGEPLNSINDYANSYNIVFSLTNDCNLNCKYCFVDAGKKKDRLSINHIKKYLIEAVNICKVQKKQLLIISFFGGEPTLCLDEIKLTINLAKELCEGVIDTCFSMTTNGVFNEVMLKTIIDNNFILSISMDGPANIQNEQRPTVNGKGSFDHIIKNVKKLLENDIKTKIRVTITKYNIHTMVDFTEYLANIGIEEVQFEVVTESEKAKINETSRPPKEDFLSNLRQAINYGKQNGIIITNTAYVRLLAPTLHYCDGMGKSRKVINYDGSISGCVEVNDTLHPAKKYFILDSLTRDSILEKNPISETVTECKSCFAKYLCAGGCPSRNYHANKDIYKPDEFRCYIVKNIIPEIIREM